MALTTEQIQKAYIAFFNRPADVSGLKNWLQHTGDDADLLVTFSQSKEYTDLFTGKTPEEIVATVYQNLFARTPDPGGLQNWVNNLKAGTINIGNIAYEILTSAGAGDIDTIAAKLEAAAQFTKTLALDPTKSTGYETGGAAAGVIVREWFSQIGESGSGKQNVLDDITDVGKQLAALGDNTGGGSDTGGDGNTGGSSGSGSGSGSGGNTSGGGHSGGGDIDGGSSGIGDSSSVGSGGGISIDDDTDGGIANPPEVPLVELVGGGGMGDSSSIGSGGGISIDDDTDGSGSTGSGASGSDGGVANPPEVPLVELVGIDWDWGGNGL